MCYAVECIKNEAAAKAAAKAAAEATAKATVIATISAYREFDVSENDIENRIMNKFNLTREKAREYMDSNMDENTVKNTVRKLDLRLPEDVRKKAFETLLKTEDKYLPLLFDIDAKLTWEGFVKLTDKIGYPRNKELLPKLIWLLKDTNWPGALLGIDVLCKIPKNELVSLTEFYVKQAYDTGDYMWLGGLKLLIADAKITEKDFRSPTTFSFLDFADF